MPNIDLNETQSQIEWLKEKLFLNTIANNAGKRLVKRGQVYKCNLGFGVGSEMQKERPCVIVQQDIANIHSSNTFVVPITHGYSAIPTVVPIAAKMDFLGAVILDGNANVSNLTCVSKARLGDYICDLLPSEMKLIDEAIAKAFGIMHYYENISTKLENKLNFLETVKKDRNAAQDKLKDIKDVIENLEDSEIIIEEIKKIIESN